MLVAIILAYVVCRRYADPSNARRIERFEARHSTRLEHDDYYYLEARRYTYKGTNKLREE